MPLVKIDDFDGRKVDVNVDDGGTFWAKPDGPGGDMVKAPTMDGLRKKILARFRTAKTRLAVPVTLFKAVTRNHVTVDCSITGGHVTGCHATNGNLLVRWADGKTEQLSRHEYNTEWLRELTMTEATELRKAHDAKVAAAKACDEMIERLKVDPRELVKDALTAAGVESAE